MFSSLASFLFGSNTSTTTNCEPNKNSALEKEQKLYLSCDNRPEGYSDEKDTITKANLPTLLTTGRLPANTTRDKNKRNNRKNKNKKQLSIEAKQPTSSELSLSSEPETLKSSDGDFDSDENGWFFVEKEDVKTSNLISRTNSEEKLSLIKENNRTSNLTLKTPVSVQQKNCSNDSCQYQQSNYENHDENNDEAPFIRYCDPDREKTLSDEAITQSLYAVPRCQESCCKVRGASCENNGSGTKLFTMVDSWYLTPPPCFNSNVPIQLVISPFENLLIEHPSMSVYHSIRSSQKAIESFVNVDLKENRLIQVQVQPRLGNTPKRRQRKHGGKENVQLLASPELVGPSTMTPGGRIGRKTEVVKEERTPGPRIDRCTAAQLKMELFEWNSQKCKARRDRQNLRRNAILRVNQVREIQGRGNRERRSDLQHCRIISGANNNRKCCY